ncbi:MAG: hypothetical protein N2690_01415 [Rhodocyclaceae bacterium]|nr:hypothetical protein [Rhodocyclaceae bacterium]
MTDLITEGLTRHEVARVLREMRRWGRSDRRYSSRYLPRILALRLRGWSIAKIAAHYGVGRKRAAVLVRRAEALAVKLAGAER